MTPLKDYVHESPPLHLVYSDRVHYACGRNVLEGWLNVDGFDESFPNGDPDHPQAHRIYRLDLTGRHPFKAGFFRFGYSEDFLEHLDQAESLLFLAECTRCFAPGGVLRLSFPGLAGILRRHFPGPDRAAAEHGVQQAYARWWHKHFYTFDEIDLVARHLGWRDVRAVAFGASEHPELRGLDTRVNQIDLNLIVELTR